MSKGYMERLSSGEVPPGTIQSWPSVKRIDQEDDVRRSILGMIQQRREVGDGAAMRAEALKGPPALLQAMVAKQMDECVVTLCRAFMVLRGKVEA